MKTIKDFAPADRYLYDFGACSIKNGFAQVDTSQDACYYGTWASPDRLMVVTYAEGDVIIRAGDTVQEFVEELRNFKIWNQKHGYKFSGIDTGFNKDLEKKFRAIGLGDLLYSR